MMNMLKVFRAGSLVALLGVAPVQASTLIRVQDLRTDGADYQSGTVFGDDSRFEIYDLELATVNGETVIRLDSNLPLAGVKDKKAADGHIGYGDLFIETAQGTYAVKFAPNGSTLPTGVYKNAVGVNLAAENNGSVVGRSNPKPTNLVAGDRIGDVTVNSVPGTEGSGQYRLVIAFSEALLPAGDRQLYITQECHNDTVELAYSYVPAVATDNPAALLNEAPHLEPALASSQSAEPTLSGGFESSSVSLSPPSESIPSEAYIGAGVVGVTILLALLLGGDSDDGDSIGSFSNPTPEGSEVNSELPNVPPGTTSSTEPDSADSTPANSDEPTEPSLAPDDTAEPGPLPTVPTTDTPSAAVPVPGLGIGWFAAAGLLFLVRRLKARR